LIAGDERTPHRDRNDPRCATDIERLAVGAEHDRNDVGIARDAADCARAEVVLAVEGAKCAADLVLQRLECGGDEYMRSFTAHIGQRRCRKLAELNERVGVTLAGKSRIADAVGRRCWNCQRAEHRECQRPGFFVEHAAQAHGAIVILGEREPPARLGDLLLKLETVWIEAMADLHASLHDRLRTFFARGIDEELLDLVIQCCRDPTRQCPNRRADRGRRIEPDVAGTERSRCNRAVRQLAMQRETRPANAHRHVGDVT
jgi:hypothetical protein